MLFLTRHVFSSAVLRTAFSRIPWFDRREKSVLSSRSPDCVKTCVHAREPQHERLVELVRTSTPSLSLSKGASSKGSD